MLVSGGFSIQFLFVKFIDSFHLNKEIYQIPDQIFKKNLSNLVEIFEVEEFLKKQVRQLSSLVAR